MLDEPLKFVRLQWTKTDGGVSDSEMCRFVKLNDRTVVEKWFRAIPFQIVLSTVHA